jgi:hypothetical protein
MQTPGIEADILQRPMVAEKDQPNYMPNVDLNIDCSKLNTNELIFFFIALSWVCIIAWWCLRN